MSDERKVVPLRREMTKTRLMLLYEQTAERAAAARSAVIEESGLSEEMHERILALVRPRR
jgi:hypothetical protein